MRDYIRNSIMCVESTLESLSFLVNPKKVAGKRLRNFIEELVIYFFENEVEKLREFDLAYWEEKLSAIEYYNSEVRGKGYWALVHSMNLVGAQLEILFELQELQKKFEEK
jgi:Zn-dependent oligopeptidase